MTTTLNACGKRLLFISQTFISSLKTREVQVMEDVRNCLLRLKQLTEEYVVAVEICQHGQVGKFLTEICVCLVELCDGLLEIDEPCDRSIDLKLIDFICRRLRKQAELVLAYNDVLDFVSLQDFSCLRVLLGASLPADLDGSNTKEQPASSRELGVDGLASILRKSVYLLCSHNHRQPELAGASERPPVAAEGGANAKVNREELLLNKSRELDRIERSGFPIFVINTGADLVSRPAASFSIAPNNQQDEASPSTTTTTTATLQDKLHNTLLDTDWFAHFLAKALAARYPVDRLPVLVAIWQVAVEARHRTLERLIGELVDQVAHEEANSCAEEELLQLSQPGSFWLTWRKRYQPNVGVQQVHHRRPDGSLLHRRPFFFAIHHGRFNRSTTLPSDCPNNERPDDAEESEEDADDEESSQDEGREAPTSSSSAASASPDSDSSTGGGRPTTTGKQNSDAFRLRRIIDRELMQNGKCVICGRQPSGALLGEPLNKAPGCPDCGFQAAGYRCALSFRPLALVGLRELLRAQAGGIKRFVLISPNEWARQMLQARRANFGRASESQRRPPVGERLVIGETFERLTVVRHRSDEPSASARRRLNDGSNSSFSSSTSSSRSGSASASDAADSHSAGSSASGPSSANQLYTRPRDKRGEKPSSVGLAGGAGAMQQLGVFAATVFGGRRRRRGDTRTRRERQQVSLSVQLMKFVMNSCASEPPEELALCSGDLLLVDTGSPDEVASMKPVVAVTPSAPGSLWVCAARSSRSRLPVGCFQLFSGTALIRLGLLPSTCKCPVCGQARLTPVAGHR